jgi:hypothetical protein
MKCIEKDGSPPTTIEELAARHIRAAFMFADETHGSDPRVCIFLSETTDMINTEKLKEGSYAVIDLSAHKLMRASGDCEVVQVIADLTYERKTP